MKKSKGWREVGGSLNPFKRASKPEPKGDVKWNLFGKKRKRMRA